MIVRLTLHGKPERRRRPNASRHAYL